MNLLVAFFNPGDQEVVMSRQRLLGSLGLCLVFVLVLGTAPASAANTANFQGNCNWNAAFTQFTCTFNALRPSTAPSACPGSFIWKYRWDFDDGSTSGLLGVPTYTKTFSGSTDPLVTLNVLCWAGEPTIPTKTRPLCVHFSIPGAGCLYVNGTWN
jgi:hypothetical protein